MSDKQVSSSGTAAAADGRNPENPMLERHYHVILCSLTVSAAIVVTLVGCDEPAPEAAAPSQFFYAVEVKSPGWDTLVYVNGNPVQRLGAEGADRRELTIWVRAGTNTVRIESTRTSQAAAAKQRCLVRFTQSADADDSQQTEIIGQIDESPADLDRYEVEFAFDCPNDYRWAWQSSDAIGEFGEADRAEIVELIDALALTLRDKDIDSMVSLPWPYWDSDSPQGDAASEEFSMTIEPRELAKTVFQYEDYVVVATPPEQLSFVTGEQTVMVCRDPQADPDSPRQQFYPLVIYAGKSAIETTEDDQPPLAFNHSQLHFIKRDGKWLILSL